MNDKAVLVDNEFQEHPEDAPDKGGGALEKGKEGVQPEKIDVKGVQSSYKDIDGSFQMISPKMKCLVFATVVGLCIFLLAGLLGNFVWMITGVYIMVYTAFILAAKDEPNALVELKYGEKSVTVKRTPKCVVWTMFVVDIVFILANLLTLRVGGIVIASFLIIKVLFMLYFKEVKPVSVERFEKFLRLQWTQTTSKFSSQDTVLEILKERKVVNFLLILMCQILCVVVIAAELNISDWDDKNFAIRTLDTGMGYGNFHGLQYYTSISCGVLLLLSGFLAIGTLFPTVLGNISNILLSLLSGIYFALLSTASMQVFVLTGEMSVENLLLRSLQLLPIPFIAVILIAFSFQSLAVYVRQDDCKWKWWRITTSILSFPTLLLASTSLVATQVWTKFSLERKWNMTADYADWSQDCWIDDFYGYHKQKGGMCLTSRTKFYYTINLGLQTGICCVLAILVIFNFISGSRKIPGLLKWICSGFILAQSIMLGWFWWNLKYDKRIEAMADDVKTYILTINLATTGVAFLVGVYGSLIHILSFVKFIVFILRFPVVFLAAIIFAVFEIYRILVIAVVYHAQNEGNTEQADVEAGGMDDKAKEQDEGSLEQTDKIKEKDDQAKNQVEETQKNDAEAKGQGEGSLEKAVSEMKKTNDDLERIIDKIENEEEDKRMNGTEQN